MRVPHLGPGILSFGSALLASSCCLLPVAIILLGMGSGAFMAVTMRWRPVFVPAALLGLEQATGAVEAGLEADLIAVDGNPLENVLLLQDPLLVVSNGVVVVDRLEFGKP